MSRKPIHIELRGGKSQRQRVWEAMRLLTATGDFTEADIANAARLEADPVRDYRICLVAGGWLECTETCSLGLPARYRLIKDNGAEAPRVRRDGSAVIQGRGNEALWGAICVLDTFTTPVLAELTGAKLNTVKTYCTLLARAGYIVADQPGKGIGRGGVLTVWRTLKSRNSGPRAPMVTRLKAVYDPNLHQIVWSEGADEAMEACDGRES